MVIMAWVGVALDGAVAVVGEVLDGAVVGEVINLNDCFK
jgi:hypothetical protein